MHALKISHVGYDDAKQVIKLPGHQVTLHHLGQVLNCSLECGKLALFLSVQSYVYEDIARESGLSLVQQCGVSFDKALFLQAPNSSQAGGFRQAHQLRQIDVADTAVLLQSTQDRSIEFIECHSGLLRIEISIRNILPLFTHFVSHSASELRSGGGILLNYHKQCFGESDMKIGIPKEIKTLEFRVGMVPSGVRELVHDGHEVIVETNAGVGIGMTDADYEKAGATVVAKPEAVFAEADLIVKVKEPQLNECAMLRPDQVLFTYLHLAADPEQAKALVDSGTTAIAYETVTAEDGSLPLLTPMSEVAGRLSIQAGAYALQKATGGRGVLLGGVPGVAPGKVVIIGGGIAGTNAAEMAIGLGAQVTIIDRSVPRLREIDDIYGGRVHTEYSTKHSIELCVTDADLVVGAVLIAGAAAPKLVTAEHVKQMRAGSVLVDISIDQGGCFETSRPTTHAEPTYVVDDVVHYCVTNMPGAVPRTSTFALTNVTLPFVKSLADLGWVEALIRDPHLAMGLNVHSGHVNHEAVAHDLGYDYLSADDALKAA